jgi:hypothetical protein
MPISPSGILLIGTWVLTQPIDISINPTGLWIISKSYSLHDKCPLGQLSCESIWFHKEFQRLVIDNQSEWATTNIRSKWWNNLNNYKAFPCIWIIFGLHLVIGLVLAYATANFGPSSLNWVNTTPNLKVLQSVCNWNGHHWMGCL